MNTTHNILIVEDEPIIRMSLRKLLQRHGFEVNEAESVADANHRYNLDNHDLIISDLRLPGEPGTRLIEMASKTPVLIMTSYASLRSAVDAMRTGAVDYIAKPFDHDEMVKTVKRILSEPEKNNAPEEIKAPSDQGSMIGNSDVMRALYSQLEKVAPTDATVLVHGETGTGKELVARHIHSHSQRNGSPLISINCAAIPETLIESELFGHQKGAFTGADTSREGLIVAADNGTLFLDEIGELPMEAQARLLRVLQEGEVRPIGSTETRNVNVRLLAATHRDLAQRCQEGLFREDLFFRLNVIQLHIPPLRERGEDIIALSQSLIERYCETYNKSPLSLSAQARHTLLKHHWPGNVRELENTIQRAVILCENSNEVSDDLLDLSHNPPSDNLLSTESAKGIPEDLSLEDYFQQFVLEHQDTMSETELARRLGISRKSLWERRQKLGIPRKKSNKSL